MGGVRGFGRVPRRRQFHRGTQARLSGTGFPGGCRRDRRSAPRRRPLSIPRTLRTPRQRRFAARRPNRSRVTILRRPGRGSRCDPTLREKGVGAGGRSRLPSSASRQMEIGCPGSGRRRPHSSLSFFFMAAPEDGLRRIKDRELSCPGRHTREKLRSPCAA
jgi:hypothetical protein